MYTWSLAWMTVFLSGSSPVPKRIMNATRPPVAGFERGHPVADPALVQRQFGHADVARRVTPLGGLGLAGQDVEQSVRGPRHRRHRRDAEPLVDGGALGVVDAGDDALDAEGLARDPRGDDVGVVTRGHRGERARALDAGPQQHVPVEAHPEHALTGEFGGQAVKGGAVAVDNGDFVADSGQAISQRRAYPAASHHDYTHASILPVVRQKRIVANLRTRNATAIRAVRLLLALVSKLSTAARRLVLGRPFRSDAMGHTLLPKRIALPVFASDALSSVAYAPEEIFLVLSVAGLSAYTMAPWIGLAVAAVMLVVIASYRQNVHAYPSGGGDYEVVTTNLGPTAGSDGGQRAAGRLRADGRGVDGVGDVQHRLGGAVHRPAQGAVRRRRHPDPGVAEPARHPGVGHGLRDSHLRLHDRHVRHDRLGAVPDLRARRPPAGRDGELHRQVRTRRRPGVRDGLPGGAGVLVGLCGADRCRGHQQRRAGVQEAEVAQRGDDAAAARRHRGVAVHGNHRVGQGNRGQGGRHRRPAGRRARRATTPRR